MIHRIYSQVYLPGQYDINHAQKSQNEFDKSF